MADNSAIEWTDASWNPIRARNLKTGKIGWHCEHATTGCEFCYAEGFNKRLGTGLPFKPGHRQDIEIFLDEKMLTQPLRWKKPRKIFVGSMTDLFAEFVTEEHLDKIFAVMALAPQHTFQVLTKRAGRQRDYLSDPVGPLRRIHAEAAQNPQPWRWIKEFGAKLAATPYNLYLQVRWPLHNVWIGVSTERQQEADERIPLLLQTPAAIRFISAEPLLGPIDLTKIPVPDDQAGKYAGHGYSFSALEREDDLKLFNSPSQLDWVIVGGESGPGARPMHPDWARSLRNQCSAAGVPFFFKQWGEWAPSTPEAAAGNPRSGWRCLAGHPHVAKAAELYPEAGAAFVEHMGKKRAGRLLDGNLHNEFPTTENLYGV
jgi:protein gp37